MITTLTPKTKQQLQVDVIFCHTRIANRGWATRRLRQLMDAVRFSATTANPFGGQIMMDVACYPGYPTTIASIYMNEFTDEQVVDFVMAMNRHRGISAKIFKNVEQPA